MDGEGQAPLRNLETQTTLPFGQVDDQDLTGALESKFNQPLCACLFADLNGEEVKVDELLRPAAHWIDTRLEQGDIQEVDQDFAEACVLARDLKQASLKHDQLRSDNEKQRERDIAKIEAAADAMVAMQKKRLGELGPGPVEDTPVFKTNLQNIMVWKNNKIQVLDKAHQCLVANCRKADDDMTIFVEGVIQKAHEKWLARMRMESSPELDLDPALLGELEAIMETSESHKVTWLKHMKLSDCFSFCFRTPEICPCSALCTVGFADSISQRS